MSLKQVLIAFGVALLAGFDQANAGCKLGKIADLPVTMVNMQPLVSARINGAEVRFVADTGAFFSSLTPGNAAELKLPLHQGPVGLYVRAVGGDVDVSVATVKTLTLAGANISHIEFLVGGGEVGSTSVGLLGENVLGLADGEYDLANGMISLIRPDGCSGAALAYWDRTKPYSVVSMTDPRASWRFSKLTPSPMAIAYLNGARLRVTFDTGAATSVLSLDAAARAGVKPDSPGVVDAGYTFGVGRRAARTWIAPFDSFKVGDEEIKHIKLRIGKIGLDDTDMLLGADFFLSHHVYIANSQQTIYFTYNGGPVFNLASAPPPSAEAAASPDVANDGAASPPPDEPKDADGYSRRGSAYLARRDVAKALADLTRAVDLAPNEPQYVFERGQAYIANKQPFLAMQDLDAALKLKPDLIPALIVRGELRLVGKDQAGALADLDAADRSSAKEADVRLTLGSLFSSMGRYERALGQFDLWLRAHPDDRRQPQALNGRCWARAQLGQDLDKALSDCNASLRQTKSAAALDSRGLVELRLGRYDQAIADYDAALAMAPKLAWSLYGRGLAKLKTGRAAEGQADVAAAVAIKADLPDLAKARGVAP